MRPPEFTGGNGGADDPCQHAGVRASMRPPEFTGGNAIEAFYRTGNYKLQ